MLFVGGRGIGSLLNREISIILQTRRGPSFRQPSNFFFPPSILPPRTRPTACHPCEGARLYHALDGNGEKAKAASSSRTRRSCQQQEADIDPPRTTQPTALTSSCSGSHRRGASAKVHQCRQTSAHSRCASTGGSLFKGVSNSLGKVIPTPSRTLLALRWTGQVELTCVITAES